MKITIRNLGVIREAEFDLKPLTILIGPNNAGKTWLAYTLAGIFGRYGFREYTKGERTEQVAGEYSPLVKAVQTALTTGASTIDLHQFAQKYGETYFNNVAQYARTWLSSYMSTVLTSFDQLEISIDLAERKEAFLKHVIASNLQIDIGKTFLNIRKKKGQKKVSLYTFSKDQSDDDEISEHLKESLPQETIEADLTKEILRILHQSLYPDVVTLPTERTTYIAFPHNAFMYLLSQLLENTTHIEPAPDVRTYKLEIRSSPKPVTDYNMAAMRAATMGSKEIAEREKHASQSEQIKEYIRLAQLLQQYILGGEMDFSEPEPGPQREIVFKPTDSNQPLEISITSSMVKELSPLVFYLRYFAQPGELLIIDEPEMNLHPKAQAQIIEFLAMLVNAGLHILVTTHSPYMIDHLNNLTKAYEHADKDAISAEFYLQNKQAFIAKENAAVYLVDQGTIQNAMDETVDWDTFGEVSDRISEIYFKL